MPYFNQAINLNFRRMNISSLAIYFFLPASVLHGLDFCPDPELHLKAPLHIEAMGKILALLEGHDKGLSP